MTTAVAGQVLGREYRLERPLGHGGMGEVWLATQLTTGRPRALKVLAPALGLDARACARFVDEAHVGARIPSEHVVEVVGAGVDEATRMPWLAMELLEGEDLAHVIERRGAIPPTELAGWLEQMGHALGAAHAAGIVHRDLKPENVFLAHPRRVGAETMVKVLDFGIAAILPDDRTNATVTSALGTPLWWAPEQMQVGEHVRPATDVWPLGLMAFHALTGRYYWRAPYASDASVAKIVTEILMEPLVPASVRAREQGVQTALPDGFDAWFGSCVVRDPKARFRDARAAIAALLPMLRAARPGPQRSLAFAATAPVPVSAPAMAVAATRPVVVETADTLATPSAKRRVPVAAILMIGGTLAAAAVLIGLVGTALTRPVGAPPPRPPMATPEVITPLDASLAQLVVPDAGAAPVIALALIEPRAHEHAHPAEHAPAPAPSFVPVAAPSSVAPAPELGTPPPPPPVSTTVPAALTSVSIEGSAPTRQFGNPSGGSPFDDACGEGEALVGLEGNSVPYVGRIRAICGRLALPSGAGAIRVTGTRALAEHGRLGGALSRITCADDQVVVGMEGRFGLLVDQIVLRCAPLTVDAVGNVDAGAVSTTGAIGGSGGDPAGSTSCPAGRVARVAHVRAGDGLDAFALGCGAIHAR